MIKPIEQSLELDVVNLKKAALVYRAINHKLRQQILRIIHQNGRITVTPLYKKMHLVQSEASMHLAILRKAGFVYAERHGKHIFYSVNYQRLEEIHRLTKSIM
ncbi:MAG TPA: metalloregulator ArsR/SmtB family transcription factor [Chitinophagaceae bacterium]|jgi:DNA-binding transcriptional ArsR family regulator|nr:metalloregulator ArsR/SmtB family transcription factor [Chitinophagaceae bacterium]